MTEQLTLDRLVEHLHAAGFDVVDSAEDARPWEQGRRPPFPPPVFFARVEADPGDDRDGLLKFAERVMETVWSRFTRGTMEFNGFRDNGTGQLVVVITELPANQKENEVLLKTGPRAGQWVPLADAFEKHDVIVDNYNTSFFEPSTEADRQRGYTQ